MRFWLRRGAKKLPKPSPKDIDTAPDSLSSSSESGASLTVTINWQNEFIDLSERHEKLKIEFDEYKRTENGAVILNQLIVPYSRKIFRFMVGYSLFVGFLVFSNMFCPVVNPVSDTVLSFLVGSTAVTVIGLVGMIVKGIFTGARK
ncbi:hypothetical protein [Asticcacaulis sp.]|uniref:hypothetical protein n=1 Tax=Asticcacaulis sp. TaxID=1872648 RepID=UPI002616D22C|nr:hypothetical protein [Asticcacaulis sp.]